MIEKKLFYAVFIVVILLFVGTLYFHKQEGWSYADSFYFSTMTLTTVGYGDFVPSQTNTKLFTSVYAILGVGVMLYLLGSVISGYLVQQGKFLDILINKLHNLKLKFHRKK